jgi:signal transduction histidine kinase
MAEIGGTLAVKGEMDRSITGHPYVVIHISDTGPGIPQDLQQHIFEPFVTTREKGTGLGLAITKQIITAHKGSIKVDSFPGGTVFTVRLPAESGD